jgi:hypothetical protein
LNVFQKAADIWGGLLPSPVTIIVRAQFDPQTCTPTSAVLGSAGTTSLHRNFAGAPLANTWYHAALASRLNGSDLSIAPLPTYDINATFNSNLNGQAGCLNGVGWYLGYDGLEGTNIELLPVVLHELGHGLGFSAQVAQNGTEPGTPPGPTIWEHFMYDNTQAMLWKDMTAAQRAASAINTNNLVWNGQCVTDHAPYVLGGTPTMFVNSGIGLAPKYPTGTAGFGAQSYNVTGNTVLVDDGVIAPGPPPGTFTDGCESPYVNAGAVSGNIAVIDRGSCTFVIKAGIAQAAGAIAVIVVNNAAGPAPALGGTDPTIVIPVVSLSQADGNALKAAMLLGPVNVTLGFDPSLLAGADINNHVKLYAPNPYQGGSSVSHYDVSATPHLLMEPAINGSLSATVDLTFWHFGDMGWHDQCDQPVAVAISGFSASATNRGVQLKARFYSTLDDASSVVVYRADGGSDDFRGIAIVDAPRDGEFRYVDDSVVAERAYRYKISVIDGDGEYFSQTADVRMPGSRVTLSQNMPNPFNPTTMIRFSLPASEKVGLAIYSANGSLVRMLVDDVRAAGTHDITWDGRDSAGNPVSSGMYFYRLNAGKFSESRKMVLLK